MDPCQGCFGGGGVGAIDWEPISWNTMNRAIDANVLSVVRPRQHPEGPGTPPQPRNPNEPTPDEVDSLMARELASLSLKEREVVENEIHGMSDNIEAEETGILDACLAEMDLNLDELKHGTAYELAENMNRNYVRSPYLRAMFIRAERWNGWEASERMIRFFELKKKLFGEEKLVKEITLEDLDDDDMECLRAGHHQMSPHKDSAGRIILISILALRKFKTEENLLRATYYIYMSAIETIESQRKGISFVTYAVDNPPIAPRHGHFRKAMPVHLASHHFCYNNPSTYAAGALTVFLMTKVQRTRFRRHFGNHMECLYQLKSFGIPDNSVPVTTAGELLTSYHIFWLETRRSMEQAKRIANAIDPNQGSVASIRLSKIGSTQVGIGSSEGPLPEDVLFVKGKVGMDHPGNLRMQAFIDKSLKQFQQSTKSEKITLAEIVASMVKDSGGKFLIQQGGKGAASTWKEIGYGATARKQILNVFRNRQKVHSVKPFVGPVSSDTHKSGASHAPSQVKSYGAANAISIAQAFILM